MTCWHVIWPTSLTLLLQCRCNGESAVAANELSCRQGTWNRKLILPKRKTFTILKVPWSDHRHVAYSRMSVSSILFDAGLLACHSAAAAERDERGRVKLLLKCSIYANLATTASICSKFCLWYNFFNDLNNLLNWFLFLSTTFDSLWRQ